MDIEYEATFVNIDKDEIRSRLKVLGAELVKPEFLQSRAVFHLPEGHELPGSWLRIRDEGNRVTCSFKQVTGDSIDDQKEIMVEVSDFQTTVDLLTVMGARQKAFQESRRELWLLDDTEVTIDEWPWLEPFVEVEGSGEDEVRGVSEKLGFDWKDAKFCPIGDLYVERYGITRERINDETPFIQFSDPNPFS